MSLSTLGSQLAALNAPGKNLGSALPTSRRHEDAIGRGLSHSVQTGHSISNKFHLHKPSIIYEDSRKASDVPLVTIRENCVSSLRQLESLDQEFGSFVDALCKSTDQRERALLTNEENEKVDRLLESLLYRLALRMGGSANNTKTTTASCLHVIEYLLRRYDMHLRPKTATTALLVMLPLHEEPYFLRLLQLIDLANLSAWSFLRPFAIPGAKLARQEISKQASNDTALTRELCRLAQCNSKLPNHAQSLSFIAMVLVEALSLQEQKFGSMDERTCKAILPYVVGACRACQNEGYLNWGHVIASAIIETNGLAEEPRKVLVTSLLKGIVGASDMVFVNGLIVALKTLAQSLDGVDSRSYQLSLVGTSTLFGFAMEDTIFTASLNVEGLSSKFGDLYEDEGIKEFAHWIASILVVAWKYIFESKNKKEVQNRQKAKALIMELLQEPKLKGLWENDSGKWVESFCSFAIMQLNSAFKDLNRDDGNFVESVLQTLQGIDAVAYEKGLANALIRSKKSDKDLIATFLGLRNFQCESAGEDESDGIILPPRVALEHADNNIRLQAIEEIVEKELCREIDLMESEGETVMQALLRRFIDDDDFRVSIAAGKGLCQLLDGGNEIDIRDLGEGSLEAVYKWAGSSTSDEKVRSMVLVQALHIVALAATKIMTSASKPELLVRLVECLGAYFNSSDASLAKESAKGLILAFRGSKVKPKAKDINTAHLLLLSREEIFGLYRRKIRKTRKSEQAIRRLCMQTVMRAFKDLFSAEKQPKNNPTPHTLHHEAVEYCMWSVKTYSSGFEEGEKRLLAECLAYTTEYVSSSPQKLQNIIAQLAESGTVAFSEVLSSFIVEVCDNVKDSAGGDVSGIAVLMELILTSSSSTRSHTIVENLLSVVLDYCHSHQDETSAIFGFAPALTLLSHNDELIRKKALDIIKCLGESLSMNEKSEWAALGDVAEYITENRSSALMGDSSFLSGCFASVASKSKKKKELQKCLLTLCVYAAVSFASTRPTNLSDVFESGWIDTFEATGGHQASVVLLTALEQAGEDFFPLKIRWQLAGKVILDGLSRSTAVDKEPSSSLVALVDVVMRMLKGIKITDSLVRPESTTNTIIMTGPASRGGRTRSYSFGKNDSISFLKPYPKDMHGLIHSVLDDHSSTKITREIQNSLFTTVLRSQSWRSGIFATLSKSVRSRIASGVLMIAVQDNVKLADETFYSLPLTASEVADLLEEQKKSEFRFGTLSYLADYSTMNNERLIRDPSIKHLFSALFSTLSSLSTSEGHDKNDDDERDFARQAILSSLLEMSNTIDGVETLNFTKGVIVEDWINLLVNILGGNSSKFHRLDSIRSKRTILALLTSLCSKYPSLVTGKLIPAMSAVLSSKGSQKEASISTECISLIVPVYLKYSSVVNLSQTHLFNAFISITMKESDEVTRIKLYQGFINAIFKATIHDDDKQIGGAFLCSCVAGEFYLSQTSKDSKASVSQVVAQILQHVPIQLKVSGVLTMLGYGKQMITNFLGEKVLATTTDVVSLEELCKVALHGVSRDAKSTESQTKFDELLSASNKTIVNLCILLMVVVCDIVSSLPFRKYLRQIDSTSSSKILLFWQDLILIQIACQNFLGGSSSTSTGEFWGNVNEITDDTLGALQSNLPAHIFLAFASTLISEGGTEELRARAAQLIADRSILLESSNPEAELFRDMLPFLANLLHTRKDGKLLLQSTLVAIESIARSLCLTKDAKLNPSHLGHLSTAIIKSADLLKAESDALNESSSAFSDISSAGRQVICSAALCASSCIRACGPRSLVTLPKLMKPLTSFLSAANMYLGIEGIDETEQGQATLMQLSILRSIIAVTETLPQFLAPYLNDLLNPFALPSCYLRRDVDDQTVLVKNISESLDDILVSQVPARVLIPAASNAVVTNHYDTASLLSLLSLLKSCISRSKAAELTGHANTLLLVLTHVLESFDSIHSIAEYDLLSMACGDLFLALVLKLSEVQLRALYARLRDWRGHFEKADPNKAASRRLAFWNLSSALGKQLRSIYLPCLSTVFSDGVDELVSIDVSFSGIFLQRSTNVF